MPQLLRSARLAGVVTLAAITTSLASRTLPLTAAEAELFANPVVAHGKGFEIRQNEVDDMVAGFKATLASTRGQTFPDEQRDRLATQMLDRLILIRIMQQRATDADRAKAKEISDKFIADTKAKARSEDAYRRQLLASGIKPELFERRAYEQAVVEAILDREVKASITISDDQVWDFYTKGIDVAAREVLGVLAKLEAQGGTNTVFYTDGQKRLEQITKANLAKLDQPERVRAQVIILQTIDRLSREELPENERQTKKQLADKIVARLKAGEDFTQVAKETSEDLEVQRTGGEYAVTREAVAYPELRTVLFNQPIGQVSDPVLTRAGYYIVKVLERNPAGKITLETSRKDIQDLLLSEETQKRLPAYFDNLKKEFEVRLTPAPSPSN